MAHTNAVYQFVSPRIKFPTKPLSLCRAFGALHGGHSVLPPSLSLCWTSGSGCERFALRYSLFCFVLANCYQPEHYRHQLSCHAVLLWLLSVTVFRRTAKARFKSSFLGENSRTNNVRLGGRSAERPARSQTAGGSLELRWMQFQPLVVLHWQVQLKFNNNLLRSTRWKSQQSKTICQPHNITAIW